MTPFVAAVFASFAFSVLGAAPIITRTIRAVRHRPGPTARPQPVSWAVWAGIMVIGGIDAAKGGQVPAAVYGLACGGECMAIAALALLVPAADRDAPVMVRLSRRHPEREIRLDWICGAGGVAGLVLLIAVQALRPSTAVLVATDALAYVPTMAAGWRSPHDEVPRSYASFAIGAGIALAIAHLWVFIAVAYPLYLLVADTAMAVITLASPHRRTAGQSASHLPAGPAPAAEHEEVAPKGAVP
jgi:hypothetical protein